MADIQTVIQSFIGLLDVMVELYLGSFMKPLIRLSLHGKQSVSSFNSSPKSLLSQEIPSDDDGNDDDNDPLSATPYSPIPEWFTPDMISYLSMILTLPTLFFWTMNQTMISCGVILIVQLLKLWFHPLVTQYWKNMIQQQEPKTKEERSSGSGCSSLRVVRDTDESHDYEVVTTGSFQRIDSMALNHRKRTQSYFLHIISTKAFLIPCWIHLLSNRTLSFVTLSSLVIMEILSAYILCQHNSSGINIVTAFPPITMISAATKAVPMNTSTNTVPSSKNQMNAVKSDIPPEQVRRVKDTLELLGTALFMLPYLHYVGLLVLMIACPLVYESTRQQQQARVVYVIIQPEASSMTTTSTTGPSFLNHARLNFWNHCKCTLGATKLIVGVVSSGGNVHHNVMIANTCAAVPYVDHVICEAPPKADLLFLEQLKITCVVFYNPSDHPTTSSSQGSLVGGTVTEEVIAAGLCYSMGDDLVVRRIQSKEVSKND